MTARSKAAWVAPALAALVACSGGSKSSPPPPPPGNHVVDLSWSANRERGVNLAGGGYLVSIGGAAPLQVPYVSGAFAPTSLTTTLYTGSYSVTVRAYAALDSAGGTTGTVSAPSTLTVHVP